jgi:hypothetical protein
VSGLFPIVRRVRRPLVLPVVERQADAKPVVVPVKAKPEPVVGGQGERRKDADGKVGASEPGKQAH